MVGSLDVPTTDLPPPPELAQRQASAASARSSGRILAIPSVRKLARDLGIDLAHVTPTGPHGRIRREDVLQAAQQRTTPAVAQRQAPPRHLGQSMTSMVR